MIQESKIIHQTRLDFFKVEEEHKNHIRRLKTAIKWFNDSLKETNDGNILGSRITYESKDCIVIHFDFSGSPNFMAIFTISPFNVNDDIGSGAGLRKVITF